MEGFLKLLDDLRDEAQVLQLPQETLPSEAPLPVHNSTTAEEEANDIGVATSSHLEIKASHGSKAPDSVFASRYDIQTSPKLEISPDSEPSISSGMNADQAEEDAEVVGSLPIPLIDQYPCYGVSEKSDIAHMGTTLEQVPFSVSANGAEIQQGYFLDPFDLSLLTDDRVPNNWQVNMLTVLNTGTRHQKNVGSGSISTQVPIGNAGNAKAAFINPIPSSALEEPQASSTPPTHRVPKAAAIAPAVGATSAATTHISARTSRSMQPSPALKTRTAAPSTTVGSLQGLISPQNVEQPQETFTSPAAATSKNAPDDQNDLLAKILALPSDLSGEQTRRDGRTKGELQTNEVQQVQQAMLGKVPGTVPGTVPMPPHVKTADEISAASTAANIAIAIPRIPTFSQASVTNAPIQRRYRRLFQGRTLYTGTNNQRSLSGKINAAHSQNMQASPEAQLNGNLSAKGRSAVTPTSLLDAKVPFEFNDLNLNAGKSRRGALNVDVFGTTIDGDHFLENKKLIMHARKISGKRVSTDNARPFMTSAKRTRLATEVQGTTSAPSAYQSLNHRNSCGQVNSGTATAQRAQPEGITVGYNTGPEVTLQNIQEQGTPVLGSVLTSPLLAQKKELQNCPLSFTETNVRSEDLDLPKRFKCQACPAVYAFKENCERHFKVVHLKRRVFRCPHCASSYLQAKTMRCHVEKIHFVCNEGISIFPCYWCQATFTTRHEWDCHAIVAHPNHRTKFRGTPQ